MRGDARAAGRHVAPGRFVACGVSQAASWFVGFHPFVFLPVRTSS